MKIISVVGARPQFVKLAPLSKEIRKNHDEVIVHTGQHFDDKMSDLFFRELEIPEPDYNLGVHGGSHGAQTGKMLFEIEKILNSIQPDAIIVFGDTNTTLAGSLVAAKLQIKSIHIEAGLRSFNRTMPEEINRIVSDHTSDYLFAPTDTAIKNLENEGLSNKSYLTGDIMVDAFKSNIEKAERSSNILSNLDLTENEYSVITLHRPYNVDEPENLKKLFQQLASINDKLVFPVHPRTKKIINDNDISIPKNIITTDPLGYLDFIVLQKRSNKIITDSGGIQKEAYILEKPCITLRPETEWLETIKEGWNILADYNNDEFANIIENFNPTAKQNHVFGDEVAVKMANIINKIV